MDVGDSSDILKKNLCPVLSTLKLPSFSLLFSLSFDRSAVSQSGGTRFRSVARLIAMYSRFTDMCLEKFSNASRKKSRDKHTFFFPINFCFNQHA